MSEEEDSHCRLCAEPTPKTQLITPDDDVGVNSKISTKMLWINIDISSSKSLPNSICYSCFDLLERTWSFLRNVRDAQTKLNEIYIKTSTPEKSTSDVKSDSFDAGKPVNEDWEAFEDLSRDVKPEILNSELQLVTMDPNSLLDLGVVKTEQDSNDDHHDYDGFNSADSDVPLFLAAKKKKTKKTKKLKYQSDNDTDNNLNDADQRSTLTWDDYMCRCADCDAQCKNIMSLRLHSLQIHSHCCTFKCSDCGKVISTYKSFVNHVRTHKKLLKYCCEFCNKCFLKTTYLKTHLNQTHDNVYSTTCHNCGSSFENSDQLKEHLIVYTKNCRKRTVKREKINFRAELQCEQCNKLFKSHSNLNQHKLVHKERSRDFACHICGKMFFTKGTLSTHMTIHDETKKFKCEYCPLVFRARGNLIAHISLHSGSKPFVCEQCGKSFRAKRHLKSHSIMHTDLMPFVCDYCSKCFRFKTRLNLHLRQHTGAKPYKCIICLREFTNGSNYKKHMRRKHNIDTSKKKYDAVVGENSLESSDVERNPT